MAMEVITIFLLIALYSPFTTSNHLVENVCNADPGLKDYQKNCLPALGSNSHAKAAQNYKTLAEISLDLGAHNTSDSVKYMSKLLKESTDPKQKEVLSSCIYSFENAAGSFGGARAELEVDIMSANYDARVAGDGAQACEDFIKLKKVHIPSIVPRIYNLRLYSSIGFTVTSLLSV